MQARSSSQRKEEFREIQRQFDVTPVNLLLDMKVRWSSTYVMLYRAESRRQVSPSGLGPLLIALTSGQMVDDFIFELKRKEKNVEKRTKLAALILRDEEWTRVRLFCNILQVRSLASSPHQH
jgi:hypothetical protein